jgi:hypothetical protein
MNENGHLTDLAGLPGKRTVLEEECAVPVRLQRTGTRLPSSFSLCRHLNVRWKLKDSLEPRVAPVLLNHTRRKPL